MQAKQHRKNLRRLALAMAIGSLFCVNGAQAFPTLESMVWADSGRFPAYPAIPPDGHTFHVSLSGGLYHDDNLFRFSDSFATPAGISRSDTVGRLGLGMRMDLPVSRQRFLVEANVDRWDYSNNGFLNNTSAAARGTWFWQVGNDWNGDVGVSNAQYLGGFGELQAPIKDMIKESRAFGSANYMLTARWRVRGALDYVDYDHTAINNLLDNSLTSTTLGVDYVTPSRNSLGAQVKWSDGDYPNPQAIAPGVTASNNFKETEISAVAHYALSGKTTMDARLGHTRRKYEQVSGRDFSGATGRLSLQWQSDAKVAFVGQVWRELRAYEALPGSFQPTFGGFTAAYVVSDGASLGPLWAPTSKISVQGNLLWEKRDFKGDPSTTALGAAERQDKYTGAQMFVNYMPLLKLQLSVGVEYGKRTSNTAGRDFDFNGVYGNARYTF